MNAAPAGPAERRGTFADAFSELPMGALLARARLESWDALEASACAAAALDRVERGGAPLALPEMAALLSPAGIPLLERSARAARRVTRERFGRTILLYAPLYLSNDCVATCSYCGFSRGNRVARRTLSIDEVRDEARLLTAEGFRHLLLVSAEHPKEVSIDYLAGAIAAAREAGASSVSIEVATFGAAEYARLAEAGAEGLVVYQETYDRAAYERVHVAGRKANFDRRLAAPEEGADAGMRRLGIGALLGLSDWRGEALAVAAHGRYLERRAWRSSLTVSLPRLRPAAGEYSAPFPVGDRDFVRMIVALRLALPDAGIVLSTRESAALRDRLIPLGVTQMSAGSRTEPGGYEDPEGAEPQFEVLDARTPAEVAAAIVRAGYDPVWKDWEESLHAAG